MEERQPSDVWPHRRLVGRDICTGVHWSAMESQTLACRIGAGLSTSPSAWQATTEAAREARGGARGRVEVDLAFLFLSSAHLDEVEAAA